MAHLCPGTQGRNGLLNKGKRSLPFGQSYLENVSLNLLLKVGAHLFAAVSVLFTTRALGPGNLGRVAFAASIVGYMALFANLGMPIYAMRRCAECRGDRRELSRTAGELFVLSVSLGVLGFLVLAGLCLYVPFFREERFLYLILGGGILLNAWGCEWLYLALERYRYMAVQSLVFKGAALGGMVLFIREPKDYLLYAALTVVATFGMHLGYFLNLSRHVDVFAALGREAQRRLRPAALIRHLRPMLPFFLMSCAVALYGSMDLVMLGLFKDERTVGLYSLVVKARVLLTSLGGIIWMAVLPGASAAWKQGDRGGFERLARKSLSLILFLQVPATLFFLLFSPELIGVLGGDAYAGALASCRIMLLALVPVGLSNILGGQILIPAGLEKQLLLAELWAVLTSFVLNLILVPRYSLNGAAATLVLVELMVWLYTRRLVKKRLGLSLFDTGHFWTLLWGAILVLPAAQLFRLLSLPPFLSLPLGAASFGLGYLLALALLGEPHARSALRFLKRSVLSLVFRLHLRFWGAGDAGVFCPCCGHRFRQFVDGHYLKKPSFYHADRYEGVDQRVICPLCGSLPRHRILAQWLEQHDDVIRGKRILHFAAEPSLTEWFRKRGAWVVSADLHQNADLRVNMEDTGLEEGWADVVVCNHVLEHVGDYRKAIGELWRILAGDGVLFLSFPLDPAHPTVCEDRSLTTPEERLKAFGQKDHVRIFGRDSRAMLEGFGFAVQEIRGEEMPEEICPVTGPADYDQNLIYVCRKQAEWQEGLPA